MRLITLAILSLSIAPAISRAAVSFQGLGDLPGGGTLSHALSVSADGSTVVGYSSSTAGTQAFRWTQSSGIQGLGFVDTDTNSRANDVSADGSVVVGNSGAAPSSQGFRWTQATGMQGLGDLAGGEFHSEAY